MKTPSQRRSCLQASLLLWTFLLACAAYASATDPEPAAPKSIVVISDDAHPPFIFRDANGNLRGILPDQWALWEKKTGIKVELRGMDWADAQRHMQEGRADVIEAILPTPERSHLYHFTQPHTKIIVPVYAHKSLGGISDLSSLKGLPIGVKAGDAAIGYLTNRGVINLKEYPSYEALILAAKKREVQVYAMSQPSCVYFLYKHGIAGDFHQSFILYSGNLHRAVHQNRTNLLRLVENGFNKISRSEYQAIERKWRGAPLMFMGVFRNYWRWIFGALAAFLVLAMGNLFLVRHARGKDAALLASREYFALVFDLINDALFIHDTGTGAIINVNRRMCEMYGYSSRRAVLAAGLGPLCSGISPYTLADALKWMRKAAADGPQVFEWHARHHDGHLFWVEINMRRVQIGGDDRLIVSVRDNTERKNTAQQLSLALKRYRMLEKQNRIVTWTIDLNGVYTSLGSETMDVGQFHPEELVGKTYFYETHPPEGREAFKARVLGYLARGEPFRNLVHPLLAKSGEIVWLSSNGIPMHDQHGHITGAWGTSTDITDLKRAESEHATLQERLTHARKLESIGRFAGTVSHDFNNMLQGILGYTDLALEQVPADQTLHSDLLEIQKTARRATQLSRQLQTFARSQVIEPKILALNEAIENMTGMLRRLVGEHIQLEWKPGGQAGHVRIDPSQLDQIMTTLCANARDAIKQTGRIVVETDKFDIAPAATSRFGGIAPGNYARLTVRDDGGGMTPEVRDQLFEPFFTTKSRGQGKGLGLFIVYGIVTQNGGFIRVESAPGQGAVFQIYLPHCAGEKTAPEPPAEVAAPVPAAHGTILLVDDEETVLCTTRRILENIGCQVLAANSAKIALNIFKENSSRIDIVIADVVMPEMNGPELVRQLLKQRPDLKYLYISGHSASFLAEQGVDGSEQNFIQKPFSQRTLAEKVQKCLARK